MEKKLDAHQLSHWLDGLNSQLATKKGNLSRLKRFSDYLSTLGIPVSLPELPRKTTEFKPYVFSMDEMTRIFETADDLMLSNTNSRAKVEFPMLLRILYGCGLRLGEATSLMWDDIDLSAGVITIKATKNKKQRIVPMSNELTRILKLYSMSSLVNHNFCSFVFMKNENQRYDNATYWGIFSNILYSLGIKNSQTVKYGSRGPCIHSLRHTFTLHSLLKAEAEGRGFMETVPFLSTYLGHTGLMETDKYLKAKYELYTKAHSVISDYTHSVFPQEV
jgi:integrase